MSERSEGYKDDDERNEPGGNGSGEEGTCFKKLCDNLVESKNPQELTRAEECDESHARHQNVLHLLQ